MGTAGNSPEVRNDQAELHAGALTPTLSDTRTSGSVVCPNGLWVTCGGISVQGGGSARQVTVTSSGPIDTADDADVAPDNWWAVTVDHYTTTTNTITIYAMCTSATSY